MSTCHFDKTKGFVFRTIILNDRLKTYEKYIELALNNDYRVCSMIEFYTNPSPNKHFVLRHDVDYCTPGTRKMYLIERDMGVHSTYYFRKTTMNIPLMNEMIDNGFEVGFHYETLSDYAIENHLEKVTENDIEKCREILKGDIKAFNSRIKKPISSLVAHGAAKNAEIGRSNNVLFQNQKYEDFGILFEGYDEDLYTNYVDEHIMDGNIRRNYGFSYSSNPIDSIVQNKTNIVFLAHPNHWYMTFSERCRNIAAYIAGRCTYEPASQFKRILDTKE